MGFVPNYLGFNMGKQVDDLKLGARASFWVTINDSETNGTDTAIDVRQFYGTVANPEWGEVLIGKDFGLFARFNILLDTARRLWSGQRYVGPGGRRRGVVRQHRQRLSVPVPDVADYLSHPDDGRLAGGGGDHGPGRHQRQQRDRQGIPEHHC